MSTSTATAARRCGALPSGQLRRRTRSRTTNYRDDSGSTTVEIALAIPIAVVLMLLVIAAGRYATALIEVQGTASAAARAASLARSPAAAKTAASHSTATWTGCTHRSDTTDTTDFRPGGHVTVVVTCTISTSHLTGLGIPGSIEVEGTSTSPIDVYRTIIASP